MWSMDKNIFRLKFQNISPTWLSALHPSLVHDGPLGAPEFLKLAYMIGGDMESGELICLSW